MRVAVGGNDLENAIVQLENRDVERAAAQIVNRNDAVLLLVETVGERCGRRLVHQPQNIQPGDAAGIFRRLPLRVVEIRGNGDDRLGYGRSEKALGIALQLAQHQRRNLRRRVGSLANLDAQDFSCLKIVRQLERKQLQFFLDIFDAAPHQALDRINRALRRFDQIPARGVAHDDLVVFVERHHRGHKVQPVFSGDDGRRIPLHVGHERVRGAEIDADDVVSCHL